MKFYTEGLVMCTMRSIAVLVLFAIAIHSNHAFLRVQNNELYFNSIRVFLSGSNIAWFNYARDFGSGAYAQVKSNYESAIDEISGAGGNVIRVWVHTDGQWSPKFDGSGHATGEDTQSLVDELGQLLDHAANKNVFVILCLWNLAVKPEQMISLYTDQAKLESYLDKVLKPIVAGLKDKPALAAYDIINEPIGGLAQGVTDSNPCYDTNNLINSGANWSGANLLAKDVLRFINMHSDAIKSVDPKALVTVGESGEQTATTICGTCRDYYSDHCLTGAGGRANGVIDFHQLHTYTWEGKFPDTSPFKKTGADFKASKPIVVGEFANVCSETMDSVKNFEYLYNNGYAGALSWQFNEGGDCADKRDDTNKGLDSIRDMTTNGHVKVEIQ